MVGGWIIRQVLRGFTNRDQFGNSVGPLRVWMKNVQAPGLAMTRSFGDKCGAKAGVTAIPGMYFEYTIYVLEILEFNITKNDKFVVIASDGVWDHIENIDVPNMFVI